MQQRQWAKPQSHSWCLCAETSYISAAYILRLLTCTLIPGGLAYPCDGGNLTH